MVTGAGPFSGAGRRPTNSDRLSRRPAAYRWCRWKEQRGLNPLQRLRPDGRLPGLGGRPCCACFSRHSDSRADSVTRRGHPAPPSDERRRAVGEMCRDDVALRPGYAAIRVICAVDAPRRQPLNLPAPGRDQAWRGDRTIMGKLRCHVYLTDAYICSILADTGNEAGRMMAYKITHRRADQQLTGFGHLITVPSLIQHHEPCSAIAKRCRLRFWFWFRTFTFGDRSTTSTSRPTPATIRRRVRARSRESGAELR
jgi:hypothetical protein